MFERRDQFLGVPDGRLRVSAVNDGARASPQERHVALRRMLIEHCEINVLAFPLDKTTAARLVINLHEDQNVFGGRLLQRLVDSYVTHAVDDQQLGTLRPGEGALHETLCARA